MSSNPPSLFARAFRTVGFRLAAGYTLLFSLSSVGILGLAYYSLQASLVSRDAESIREKFDDLRRSALTSSLEQIREEGRYERRRRYRGPTFARLRSRRGTATYFQQGQIDWSRLDALADSRSEAMVFLRGTEEEPDLELISKPISESLILQVGKSTEAREDTLSRFARIVLLSLPFVVLLAATGGAYMAGRALRPVRRLLQAVQEAEAGALSARVLVRGSGDELDELGELFNRLLGKVEALVSGMRNALDNVAHDLRTPMTRLRGTAEIALESGADLDECREALADCLEESDMVLDMLKTLMDISEAETGTMHLERETVDLTRLAREAAEVYRLAAEDKSVSILVEGAEDARVLCDRNRMRQVVGNLLDNAVKYTHAGGSVRLKTFRRAEETILLVADNGPGIPPEDIPKIWDRLFRGDSSRTQRGLGLGLSLVKAVVTAHGGRIDVASRLGEGSLFTVRLPG